MGKSVAAAAGLLLGIFGGALLFGRTRSAEPTSDSPAPKRLEPTAPPEGRTRAEWVSLAVSLIVLAALVGTISYLRITTGSGPPLVEVAVDAASARDVGGGYYLPVRVSNAGAGAAEVIRVRIAVGTDAGDEAVDLEIDRLGPGEFREAVAVFRRDPRITPIETSVRSFLPL